MSSENKDVAFFVRSFRNGEDLGFTYVFNECFIGIYYFVYQLIKDKEITDTVLDDAFIQVWKQRKRFKSFRMIKGALYVAAWHKSILVLKNRNGDLSKIGRRCFFNDIIKAEVIQSVLLFLEKVPKECRQAVLLLHINHLSVLQVSEKQKISMEVVTDCYKKGIEIIQEHYGKLRPNY